MASVIVVDDQQNWTELLKDIITGVGYDCEVASSYDEAIGICKKKNFDYAILDIRLVDEEIWNIGGIEILNWLAKGENNTKVIMLTGYTTIEFTNKAFQTGKVIAFLEKAPNGKRFFVEELLSYIVETDEKM